MKSHTGKIIKIILCVPTLVVALPFVHGLRADAATFANATSISIRDTNTAVPYPSPITVSGMTGTLATVSVRLKNLSHGSPSDMEMLLVSPTDKKFVFLSDAGGTNPISGDFILDDAASSHLPSTTISPGTYKPTDYGGGSNFFASPAPAVTPAGSASPFGTATFTEQFNGIDPNGIWNLYIMDDAIGATGTMAGGWTLTITTFPPAATLTILQSSPNPSAASAPLNTVIFTATVTSSGIPVAQGTVSFQEGASILKANATLSASGQAGYTNSTFTEGSHFITASYNGSAGFLVSTGSVTQVVYNHAVLTNVSIVPAKQFQFGFTGITLMTYTVQASTNLTNWSVLGPATENSPGLYHFSDPNISNFTRRFYRVREP